MSVQNLEECEGPGEFTYASQVYVYHNKSDGVSYALHICPESLSPEDKCLGALTRAAYHTLETIESIEATQCFVMVNIAKELVLDVTMLPVGNPDTLAALDARLKSGEAGFQTLLDQIIYMCTTPGVKVDVVKFLYESMNDIVSNQSNIAIVHELRTHVDTDVVSHFMDSIGSPV